MHKMKSAMAFCVAAMIAAPASADLLGSSEFEDCLLTDVGINCDKNVVFTAAVAHGLQARVEAVQMTTIIKDGQPVVVEEAVNIEMLKTQPIVTYPLIYDHTVAYHPRDEDSTILSDGYQIGEAITSYAVTFKVTKGASVLEFTLSPEDPIFTINEGGGGFKLKAKLIGDHARRRTIPSLDYYILYIPASPPEHPFVEFWQNNMLLVPREEVSYEGTECDKVGYLPPEETMTTDRWGSKRKWKHRRKWRSKKHKRHGNDQSDDEAIACLDNQLFDKHIADLERLSMDPTAEATYLVQGIRAFGEATLSRAPGLRVLVHEPPEIQNTVVAVTMDATTLKNIDTESLGVIRSAEVRTFKSHTRNGTMEVDIENVGDLKTDYVVAITECNQNVVPAIPAQARVLQPSQTAILKFPIYTNGHL